MLQRQCCLFFLYRHKTPLLCYTVNIVSSSYFIIPRRCYASTSILSVFLYRHKTTPLLCYNVNILFFLFRHKTPLLCYNVNIVCSFYIVIKRRCYATTSILFVLRISSSNAVVMLQRQQCLFFLFRHQTPLLCYNVNIVCSSYFLIKRRGYATTSIVWVLPISS